LRQCKAADQEWALDSAHDAVAADGAIRVLSLVDAYTKECLALVDTNFSGPRMTRVLDEIIAQRGQPRSIRCDNGADLTGRHLLAWSIERKIELVRIQPEKLKQNTRVESFHGRLREESLPVSCD
jgi:putative transposase